MAAEAEAGEVIDAIIRKKENNTSHREAQEEDSKGVNEEADLKLLMKNESVVSLMMITTMNFKVIKRDTGQSRTIKILEMKGIGTLMVGELTIQMAIKKKRLLKRRLFLTRKTPITLVNESKRKKTMVSSSWMRMMTKKSMGNLEKSSTRAKALTLLRVVSLELAVTTKFQGRTTAWAQ